MMTVNDAHGRSYWLFFRYDAAVKVDRGPRFTTLNLHGRTIRTMAYLCPLNEDGRRPMFHRGELLRGAIIGAAIYTPDRDHFVKATGRMLALDRALEAFARLTSLDDAAAVKSAYMSRMPVPPISAPTGEATVVGGCGQRDNMRVPRWGDPGTQARGEATEQLWKVVRSVDEPSEWGVPPALQRENLSHRTVPARDLA